MCLCFLFLYVTLVCGVFCVSSCWSLAVFGFGMTFYASLVVNFLTSMGSGCLSVMLQLCKNVL